MSRPPRADDFGLSEEYWQRISARDRALYARIRPLRKAKYEASYHLGRIEEQLADLEEQARTMGASFELVPDFQRGHVWTREQQVAYMENLIRGHAPATILFNCPEAGSPKGDIAPYTMECVDGLQRLTAMRAFMAGEIAVFGGLKAQDLKGTSFDPKRIVWTLACLDFSRRADLLQYYLDINAGGTVHSAEELNRVAALRDQAQASPEKPRAARKAGAKA